MAFQIQENLFGWYDLDGKRFDTIEGARSDMKLMEKRRCRRNKIAEKNAFNPNAYGKEDKYPRRIVEVK